VIFDDFGFCAEVPALVIVFSLALVLPMLHERPRAFMKDSAERGGYRRTDADGFQ